MRWKKPGAAILAALIISLLFACGAQPVQRVALPALGLPVRAVEPVIDVEREIHQRKIVGVDEYRVSGVALTKLLEKITTKEAHIQTLEAVIKSTWGDPALQEIRRPP